MIHTSKSIIAVAIACIISFPTQVIATEEYDILGRISLEDLLNIEISSASKFDESLSETPATIVVVSQRDIQARGYTSLTQVFNDLPGFDIAASNGDISQLAYMRGNRTGSFNERTLFMIDGIRQNMLYTQHMNIGEDFPLSAIDHIEVLYGPASAIYGPDAFGGIINVITKSAKKLDKNTEYFTSVIGAGSFDTKFVEMTFLANRGFFDFFFSVRRFHSDRYDITDKPGFFAEESIIGNPEIWGPYATAHYEYSNLLDSYSILSKLSLGNFEIGYSKQFTDAGSGGVYPFDKTLPTTDWKFVREKFFTNYSNSLTDDLIWNFQATYQVGGSPPDSIWAQGWNAGTTWDSERSVEVLSWKNMASKWEVSQDFVYKPASDLTVSGGIKFASGEYQQSYEFGYSDRTIWQPGKDWPQVDIIYPPILSDGIPAGNSFSDSEYGAFMQGKIGYFDNKLLLVLGARYDNNDVYGSSLNPRVGLVYQFSEQLLVKSNYGTAFQAPAPRNLGAAWGGLSVNAELKPDEIKTFDISLQQASGNIGHNITIYHNKVTNSILQGENLPDKNMFGLEYRFNFLIGSLGSFFDDARVYANYTFVDASYATARLSASTGRESDNIGDIAKNKFNLGFDVDILHDFHLNLRFNYLDTRPTTITNPIEEVDSFLITNLSLQWNNILEQDARISLTINNLFDKDYYHPGYDAASAGEDTSAPSLGWYSSRLPQAGRNLLLTLSMSF
jgi:outer membrane receptor for ferrienterochelin and colicins